MQAGNIQGMYFMARGSQVCHSEERSDVGISQNPVREQGNHRRKCNCLPEIATSAATPRNDTSGECRGAPAPSCGLITPYWALTERRYRRNRFPHCSDSLFRPQVLRAQKQAALLRPVRKIWNYSAFGPAATSALPASLPSYLTKFLTKREARSFAFSSHWEASA